MDKRELNQPILKNEEKRMLKKNTPEILEKFYTLIRYKANKNPFSCVFAYDNKNINLCSKILKFSTKRSLEGMYELQSKIEELIKKQVNIPRIYSIEEYVDSSNPEKEYKKIFTKKPLPHKIDKVMIVEEKIANATTFKAYSLKEQNDLLKKLSISLDRFDYYLMLQDIESIYKAGLEIDTYSTENVQFVPSYNQDLNNYKFNNEDEENYKIFEELSEKYDSDTNNHCGVIFIDLSLKDDNIVLQSLKDNKTAETPYFNVLSNVLLQVFTLVDYTSYNSIIDRWRQKFNKNTYKNIIKYTSIYLSDILYGIIDFKLDKASKGIPCEQFDNDIRLFYNQYREFITKVFDEYNKIYEKDISYSDLFIKELLEDKKPDKINYIQNIVNSKIEHEQEIGQ